jgi:hypothetical protein
MKTSDLLNIAIDPPKDSFCLESVHPVLIKSALIYYFFDLFAIKIFVMSSTLFPHFQQLVDISSKLITPKNFEIDNNIFWLYQGNLLLGDRASS